MSQPSLNQSTVAQAFESACLEELDAIKPGNVGRHGDGHRMTVADFEKSAVVASNCIARHGCAVGERIRTAVDATMSAVGQNTNLGIVLLCAPLAHAAQQPQSTTVLEQRLTATLSSLDVSDSENAFAAIALARPGGLGEVDRHDVHRPATVNLVDAMRAAASRDRIAWQYANNFVDLFHSGWPELARARAAGAASRWCTTAVYLRFLSTFSDSHIVRKHGGDVAERVQARALEQYFALQSCLQVGSETFYRLDEQLIQLDRDWKSAGINPGTSADLTVATLFSMHLREALEQSEASDRTLGN